MSARGGPSYAAVDLGAESGRVMAGTVVDGRVDLQEVHRFANVPVRTVDGLHWDVLRLYVEMLTGLQLAYRRYGTGLAGIGVDSWAVDYGLLDGAGRLLGNPYHYRDARTDGVREEVGRHVPPAEQYRRTGIAQLPFNTLYQLVAQRKSGDAQLQHAASLLLIPDLLHFWLTGVPSIEHTNASTTGMLGVDGSWQTDMLAPLNIPSDMLLDPVTAGTRLGSLRAAICEEHGLGPISVIVPATHDTASAVVAVPAESSRRSTGMHAYISSGTWSLLGLELDHPVTTEEARLAGFTNERGAGGSVRFLTNIMGLWLIQACRRHWARSGRSWTYDDLITLAAQAPDVNGVIDVDDPAFLHPPAMPVAIADQLARSGQPPIEETGALVRTIFEGLALSYRAAVEKAERIAGVRVHTIHIVGGGSRIEPLCRLTADICGKPVLAGPVEATALGNVLIQALGNGELANLTEVRDVARNSAEIQIYEPRYDDRWEDRYERLLAYRRARQRHEPPRNHTRGDVRGDARLIHSRGTGNPRGGH